LSSACHLSEAFAICSGVSLSGEYRSERARYLKTYQNMSTAEKNAYDALGDYKEYALLHVGSNFNITPNWNLGVALYNVFDKNFNDYERVGTSYYNRYSNTQEGRRVQLSTTFSFKHNLFTSH